MTERITTVNEGDTVNGDTVQSSCIGEDQPGHWHCVTHNEGFAHNMAKDGHCGDGRHRLAWVCLEHGYEVP